MDGLYNFFIDAVSGSCAELAGELAVGCEDHDWLAARAYVGHRGAAEILDEFSGAFDRELARRSGE